jgi:hypothetical protein
MLVFPISIVYNNYMTKQDLKTLIMINKIKIKNELLVLQWMDGEEYRTISRKVQELENEVREWKQALKTAI